jgi:hypothetical protein
MTLFAAVARMPGRVIGMAGLVAGLALVQSVIRFVAKAFGDTGDGATAGNLVFGLHAVNALAIMTVTSMIVRQARELSRSAGVPAGPPRPAS